MSLQLQRFDFRSSSYERPNQDWVCGRQSEGYPCLRGPTKEGRCRGGSECHPVKNGDRWFCTRSEAGGGKCERGPLPDGRCACPIQPCLPKPSESRFRRSTVVIATAITVALIFLFLNAGPRAVRAVVSPGPLSNSHAQIGDCSACHAGAFDSLVDLMVGAVHNTEAGESAHTCRTCHRNHSERAHGLTGEADAGSQGAPGEADADLPGVIQAAAAAGLRPRASPDGTMTCKTCHTEHGGREALTSAISNTQCNACHRAKFAGIADGHPEFSGYPFNRRTRIRFDHGGHFDKYYGKMTQFPEGAPRACLDCHVADEKSERMVIRGYQSACADCHAGGLRDQSMALLTVPGLDVEGLSDRDAAIGEWPEDADAETISPFFDMLLVAGDAYREAREALADADIDLLDLSEASDEEIALVETLAWSIKGALHDLATQGLEETMAPLVEALGEEKLGSAPMRLAAAMPPNAVHALIVQSFPNLAEEVEGFRDSEEKAETAAAEVEEAELPETVRGWIAEGFSLDFRFTDHTYKAPVQAMIELGLTAADHDEFLGAAREAVTGEEAPGGCLTCHSADAVPDRGVRVNWVGYRPALRLKELNAYSHAPHIEFLGDEGCKSCHQPDSTADFAGSYKDGGSSPTLAG